ncbi:MAG: aspartate-semialdehyde dehydrogenase [Chloroherpetonaceae bacterium]|nr:aspartate-semialdehyde dehydrogenase [Chloroherpetonaceae bacterium]MDW8437065.1 aspartate-semialdehyde dehydrogenase [Chloroherpetonaceae bacterium]
MHRVAILGATGLVGRTMIQVLEERDFPASELVALASEKSVGAELRFKGKPVIVQAPSREIFERVDIALFSAGASASKVWARVAADAGAIVIDNSSAFRMEKDVPLVVPEVNGEKIFLPDGRPAPIIANPNCSTIQMVVVLKPLHDAYRVRRVVVSTYQSVTGKGKKGMQALEDELSGKTIDAYAHFHPIAFNVVPQVDEFAENGYTKEEMKMINETKKIMGDDAIAVSPTTVRVPVYGGHSEAVNIEFEKPYDLADVFSLLENAEGVRVIDNPAERKYPMPIDARGKDEVFVGRIRRDFSRENALNLWIVADNLRKGAATNAVQIAEKLIGKLDAKAKTKSLYVAR